MGSALSIWHLVQERTHEVTPFRTVRRRPSEPQEALQPRYATWISVRAAMDCLRQETPCRTIEPAPVADDLPHPSSGHDATPRLCQLAALLAPLLIFQMDRSAPMPPRKSFASSRLRAMHPHHREVSREAARARRNEGWVYDNESDGNHVRSSLRLCAPAGNRPGPRRLPFDAYAEQITLDLSLASQRALPRPALHHLKHKFFRARRDLDGFTRPGPGLHPRKVPLEISRCRPHGGHREEHS